MDCLQRRLGGKLNSYRKYFKKNSSISYRKYFKKNSCKGGRLAAKDRDFQACLMAAHPPRSLLAAVFKKDFWRQCTRRTSGGKFYLAANNKDYLLGGAS